MMVGADSGSVAKEYIFVEGDFRLNRMSRGGKNHNRAFTLVYRRLLVFQLGGRIPQPLFFIFTAPKSCCSVVNSVVTVIAEMMTSQAGHQDPKHQRRSQSAAASRRCHDLLGSGPRYLLGTRSGKV